MCEFISESYTYVSWSSPFTLSLRKLRRASLDRIEVYADKGSLIRSKRDRRFLRNIFVIREFHSQRYCWVLNKQLANTLFVESAKWDLGAHRGPWWKRKYPQIITGEKLTERLLSDVWLHHTEFHPSLLGTVCELCYIVFCKVTFGSSLRATVKKEMSSDQYCKEAFWETAVRCVNATHRVTRFSSVFSLPTQFSGNLQLDTS